MQTVLIVDDDKDIVNALRIYLSPEGYHILEASNGKEAIAKIESEHVDLILMDIMMPEMDGVTATVKLRETSNIPIILLTAKSEDSDKILGLNVGADDYITKPFNPMEVIANKSDFLISLCEIIVGGRYGLSAEERSVIDNPRIQ